MRNASWKTLNYFTKKEFRKDPNKVHPEIPHLCDAIRERCTIVVPAPADVKMILHVVWDDTGHSSKSYHYKEKAMAVDFHIVGVPLPLQYTILTSFRQIGALGFYPWWNNPGWHMDIRRNDRRIEWLCTKAEVPFEDSDVGIKTIEPDIQYDYRQGVILEYLINNYIGG
jgi:uncharacterized protein YcbK (DUF882 family)